MFGCCSTTKMSWEPNLNDALSDPIVRTMMDADHVDPQALAANLRATAAKRQTRAKPAANQNGNTPLRDPLFNPWG